MLIRVKKVEYLCDYKLKILFSDGKTKIIDFEDWISEAKSFYLKPLKDLDFFKAVRLDEQRYSICWPNGADFCPDVLYAKGQEIPKKRILQRAFKTQKRITKQGHPKSKISRKKASCKRS